MEKTKAIAELSALLKHHSDGYYMYLANGGKNDPSVELELDALNYVIRCLQDPESLRPKGRWIKTEEPLGFQDVECIECSVCHDSWVLNEDCGFDCFGFWNYCPNCGAKMME